MPLLGATLPVNGPKPQAPRYTLLAAAHLVTDDEMPAGAGRPDAERFAGGVQVYPYPCGPVQSFDQCNPTSKGSSPLAPAETISAMVAYLASSCTTRSISDYNDFKARALQAFTAGESLAVEKEFWDGALISTNPHLTQVANGATGQIGAQLPNGFTATSPTNALSLMEKFLGSTGRAGMIHVSPRILTFLDQNFLLEQDGGLLRTIQGTIVVPGGGYSGNGPVTGTGSNPAAGSIEWMYATGLVDIRRGAVQFLPGTERDFASAIDRTLNNARFIVERPYVVTWDQCFLAAVKIDVCITTVC